MLITHNFTTSEERWAPVGCLVTSSYIGKELEGVDVLWDLMILSKHSDYLKPVRTDWKVQRLSWFWVSLFDLKCYFPFQWLSLPTFEGDNVLLILCPLDGLSTLSSCSESWGLTLLSTSPRPPGPQRPWEAMAKEWWGEEEKEMGHFPPSSSTESSSSCFSFSRRVLSLEPDLTGLPVVTNIVLSILSHLCMQSLHKSPSFKPSGVSRHGESKRKRAIWHKHREQMYRHQWGKGVEDAWGDWDSHVYTIDAMYKTDN